MNLLLVSIHYPPKRSSCAVQMKDLAEQFLLEGHKPVVIVPDDGLSSLSKVDEINGVKVYRLKSPKIIDIGYFRRAINETLLSFFMLRAIRKTDLNLKDFDGIIWYSPSIFFGPLVWYIKRVANIKSYLILRDIFPEWAIDIGVLKKGPIYYLFKLIAKFQYYVADSIGVQTESNLNYLSKWKKGRAGRRLEVLNNWLSDGEKNPSSILIKNTKLKNRKIFIYIGNMGIAQSMDIILDLSDIYKKDNNVGFLFVGRGSEVERLKKITNEKLLNNVLFYDEINPDELDSLLKDCDVGIVALDPRHKSHNIPGKFLTYMQSGLPVLARINKNTDLEKLININRVGKVYSGSNLNEFYKLAQEIINDKDQRILMSQNGKDLSKKLFSSQSATEKILMSFRQIS